jgi:glycerol-3-phosphate O-acyltransferase
VGQRRHVLVGLRIVSRQPPASSTGAHDVQGGRDSPTRYGRAMLRRFGWFFTTIGLGRAMSKLRFEDHSVEMVRTAAARGPVVYVLLNRSQLDYLALNSVLNRRRLPLAQWVNGATMFYWQPVAAAWRDVAHRVRRVMLEGWAPEAVNSGWLSRLVARGGTAALYLVEPAPFWRRFVDSQRPDALEALIDAQAVSKKPIQLVPVVVMWDRAPDKKRGQVGTFLAGGRDSPTAVGQLIHAWFRSNGAFVQVGEPVDMAAFMWRVQDPIKRVRALRTLLRRFLKREANLVRGPRLLPNRVMKRLVLDNPPMRDLARDEARALDMSEERVRRQMDKAFDQIAAQFRWWMIRVLYYALRPVWTRIYSGVDVLPEDLDIIRKAMRDGTAILLPCHKSHFDYLLLSWVFYKHDLIVPHVIAGLNLAIFPVSFVLRSAGGLFIKRSFAGERVFPAVFSRYLRELIRQRYPLEFFIEGGRTRSGKLLPPRTGVLGMVLDAAEIRGRGKEVTLLPMSLAYEQVAEEGAYVRELGGEEKKKETVGQLVKARSVLRRRFGRVYLRVGTPLFASELVDEPSWRERSPGDQRTELFRIGERVMYRIGNATVLLPTSLVALALLAHHKRYISQTELYDRIDRFRAFLNRDGIQETASMSSFGQAINGALNRFWQAGHIESFEHDGKRQWSILPDRRIALAFYKNQAMHRFGTACFATAAIRGLEGDSAFGIDEVRGPFAYLLWTLRREFRFNPDASATELLTDGLDGLVTHGALTQDGDLYRVADTKLIGEVFGLVRELLEGYAFVMRAGSRHLPFRGNRKAYAKALQDEGQKLIARDVISRPEALSLETLGNAVSSLREEGILEEADGRLSEHPDVRKGSLAWLAPMVD